MSRRMIFVLAVSALAGLAIAFMLGEKHVPRPAVTGATPSKGTEATPADDMAAAIRKAIEGNGNR